MTAPPRQNIYFQPYRFPTRDGKHPIFPREQFLQGKGTITCPDMENMPALLWNQSIQGNEKNMDTCTFIPGSTTLSRHSMLSTLTHPRRVSQNFQQLEDGKFQHSGTSMLQSQC